MAHIIFYEKPGCINNGKQKTLLVAAGHKVQAHNLLTMPWTAESLRPFFGDLPVAEWFNPSAPRIKSGEVIPTELDEVKALELMLADRLLIRRPLMQVGDRFSVGFNLEKMDAWIGLTTANNMTQNIETCPRSHTEVACSFKV